MLLLSCQKEQMLLTVNLLAVANMSDRNASGFMGWGIHPPFGCQMVRNGALQPPKILLPFISNVELSNTPYFYLSFFYFMKIDIIWMQHYF